MVKKIVVFIGIIIAIVSFSFIEQSKDKTNIIIWSADKKLTWDDFLAPPPVKSKFAAISSLDVKYRFYTKKDTLFYSLANKFFRDRSWVYLESKKARLLGHEQTHFDILELYCRKLRQFISKTPIRKTEYKKTIVNAYNSYYKQYKTFDSLYDQETDFSNNITIQHKWTEKINKDVLDLEQFSDTSLIKILVK